MKTLATRGTKSAGRRTRLLSAALFSSALVIGCARQPNIDNQAADLTAALVRACPMTAPSDLAAHDHCRKNIGKDPALAGMREHSLLWGGDAPNVPLKEKNTTVFRGDLFQDLYLSLFMFTGKYAVSTAGDGSRVVTMQAYFRNALPPGHYPYPFWHSDKKWDAYEKANEVRFYFSREGKVAMVGRSDAGSNTARGNYVHVQPPVFTGQWLWTDAKGVAQPAVTLFSDRYSKENPNVAALDAAYKTFALNLRNSDCLGCHAPDGHKKMRTLTLLQTPMHAATNIDEVLREVRDNKMPLDDNNDPKRLGAEARSELLANGEAFQILLKTADAWERENGQSRAPARKVAAR